MTDIPTVRIRPRGDFVFNEKAKNMLQLRDSRNSYIKLWIDEDSNSIGFTVVQKPDENCWRIQQHHREFKFTNRSILKYFGLVGIKPFHTEIKRFPMKGSSDPKWYFNVS